MALWYRKGKPMRTETINLYQFHELNDEAKAQALRWLNEAYEYPWFDEDLDSIKAFCDLFNVKVENYEIGAWSRASFIKTNATNDNFRGFTLKQALALVDTDLTGYCLDYDLTQAFYSSFKVSGDAKGAFDGALHEAIKSIEKNIEWSYSDEALIEWSECNEFEFLASGKKA
jgi:hypothetical protein